MVPLPTETGGTSGAERMRAQDVQNLDFLAFFPSGFVRGLFHFPFARVSKAELGSRNGLHVGNPQPLADEIAILPARLSLYAPGCQGLPERILAIENAAQAFTVCRTVAQNQLWPPCYRPTSKCS